MTKDQDHFNFDQQELSTDCHVWHDELSKQYLFYNSWLSFWRWCNLCQLHKMPYGALRASLPSYCGTEISYGNLLPCGQQKQVFTDVVSIHNTGSPNWELD